MPRPRPPPSSRRVSARPARARSAHACHETPSRRDASPRRATHAPRRASSAENLWRVRGERARCAESQRVRGGAAAGDCDREPKAHVAPADRRGSERQRAGHRRSPFEPDSPHPLGRAHVRQSQRLEFILGAPGTGSAGKRQRRASIGARLLGSGVYPSGCAPHSAAARACVDMGGIHTRSGKLRSNAPHLPPSGMVTADELRWPARSW